MAAIVIYQELPDATETTKGGVSVDTSNGLTISGGRLGMSVASASRMGVVSIADGGAVTSDQGAIDVRVATTEVAGKVRPDGETITIDVDGTIHSTAQSTDAATIPTKVSELTNDSGFLTDETDPTVPAWAKTPTKPTYTAEEVGALSADSVDGETVVVNGDGKLTAVSSGADWNSSSGEAGYILHRPFYTEEERTLLGTTTPTGWTNWSFTKSEYRRSEDDSLILTGQGGSYNAIVLNADAPDTLSDLKEVTFFTSRTYGTSKREGHVSFSKTYVEVSPAPSGYSRVIRSPDPLPGRQEIRRGNTVTSSFELLAWAVDSNGGTHMVLLNGVDFDETPSEVSLYSSEDVVHTIPAEYETDPTVPAWAKTPTKPTYTAEEVGALSNDVTIPTKVSELTNDSGFVTSSQVAPGFNGSDLPNVYDLNVAKMLLTRNDVSYPYASVEVGHLLRTALCQLDLGYSTTASHGGYLDTESSTVVWAINELSDRIDNHETRFATAEVVDSLASENESLRSQLASLRKKVRQIALMVDPDGVDAEVVEGNLLLSGTSVDMVGGALVLDAVSASVDDGELTI